MTEQQMHDLVIGVTKDLAALAESVKSAHQRIDENNQITSGIHDLAKNVGNLATQVKMLTEHFERSISRIENGQRDQGERIGQAERLMELTAALAGRLESTLTEASKRLEAIEKEPGAKWKTLTAQIISLVVAAIVGAVFAHVF
jgi:ABC-type transporter Mla subunit MlaD